MCANDLTPTLLLQQQEIARVRSAYAAMSRVLSRVIDAMTLLQVRNEAVVSQLKAQLEEACAGWEESQLDEITRITSGFRTAPSDNALQAVENLVTDHGRLKAEVVRLQTELALRNA